MLVMTNIMMNGKRAIIAGPTSSKIGVSVNSQAMSPMRMLGTMSSNPIVRGS